LLPDKDAKELYLEAYKKAEEAVVLNPRSAGAHYFLGLSSAKIARLAGAFSSLGYVHKTQKEMKKVIDLEPGFSEAGAYRVLGKMYHEMPGALGGSNRKAREYLEKAVALAPQNALNHLFLAQVLKSVGEASEARSEALRVISTPEVDRPGPKDEDPRKEAEKLLGSLPKAR